MEQQGAEAVASAGLMRIMRQNPGSAISLGKASDCGLEKAGGWDRGFQPTGGMKPPALRHGKDGNAEHDTAAVYRLSAFPKGNAA
jgi:hypothetical protein